MSDGRVPLELILRTPQPGSLERTKANDFVSKARAEAEAFTMASSDDERSVLLQDLAWNAVAVERWDAATIVAGKLLESAEACRGTWQYGNAVHHGHIVLGEVALARRDFDRAERELREAAATPGSPQLNSFGPNLDLAAALARLGRRDAVIEYLENCKAFWKHKDVEIDEWLATLRRGELPAFAIEETESDA